ncbi:hypothetical protein F5888DRAFT_1613412 [Russula emetica]|nr:hypothetical protein F5888DRAFT_1613412 [Russula emetica]
MSLTISRLPIILVLFLSFLLSPNTRAQELSFTPSFPLAVRSPYLNCWLQFNNTYTAGFGTWPTTFNHSQVLGWTVLVRVDNLTYSFIGDVDPNLVNGTVNATSFTVSPSTTILRGVAGPVEVNLTFLNPIEPQDWVKQSIPFSYMSFTAKPSDSANHYVQVYSDISGEWMSGDRTQKILWNTTWGPPAIFFHNVTLQTSAIYTEILDQPEWGTLYFATPGGPHVSFQSGLDADCRGNFTLNGYVNGQQDQNRSISDGSTVFALAYEIFEVSVNVTQPPAVWVIGFTTDPAINYTDLSGAPPTPRSPYYKTRYPTDEEMATQMVDFLNDFSNASSRAQQVDGQIFQDSESVAQDFSSLTSVALAEVYSSMQLTVWTDGHGNFNKSDVMVFMKNIGGVNKNRVNAVETIYAAFPALMYNNLWLGAPLLEPLFRLQDSHNYTIRYAAADLGSNYPNVSGSNSNHDQGVEQTGNMLIMTYAYARASGDGSQISRYYRLLTSWADYLIESTLFIHDQSSADNLTVSNQTNLAIKGIIAIEAMSKMSSAVKNTDDANKYSSEAARLYAQWKSVALGSDQHLLAAYGQSSDSWTLGYNLFADVWLGTSLVELPVSVLECSLLAVCDPFQVYNGHSNFINDLVSNSNFSNYGMPIDNAVPTDTSAAVSSWYLYDSCILSLTSFRV